MPLKLFEYGDVELEWLASRDERLGRVIAKRGFIEQYVYTDLFECMVVELLAQQISSKAHRTMVDRLNSEVDSISAKNILKLGKAGLDKIGVRGRKNSWILGLAESYTDGRLNVSQLLRLTDTELLNTLVAFDGIGKWTAEMIMIFGAQRKNVLSIGDYGIRKGIARLYCTEPNARLYRELCEIYSPYASIASFYLWAVSGGEV